MASNHKVVDWGPVFLEHLHQNGGVKGAAKAAGVAVSTVHNRMRLHPEFRVQVEETKAGALKQYTQKQFPKGVVMLPATLEWRETWLTVYANTGIIRLACEAAGVTRNYVYQYREDHPDFMEQWEAAKADAIDALENEARMRALTISDPLLLAMLRAYKPEYREKSSVELTGRDGGPIQSETVLDDDERVERLAALLDRARAARARLVNPDGGPGGDGSGDGNSANVAPGDA